MKTYKTTIPCITLKKNKTEIKKVKITNSIEVAEYARQFYYDDIELYESVFIILMNQKNNTIGFVKISQGGVSSCIVDVKLIAKYTIESLASNVILVHNHPSGDMQPSQSDISLTKKVNEGLSLFDAKLLDHVIITSDEHYSLADNDIL